LECEVDEQKVEIEKLKEQIKINAKSDYSSSNNKDSHELTEESMNLRSELEAIKEKYTVMEKEHNSLLVKYQSLKEETNKNNYDSSNDIMKRTNDFKENTNKLDDPDICGFGIDYLEYDSIIDIDSFHFQMNCFFNNSPNLRNSSLIMCNTFHELCNSCLKKYYLIKYKGRLNDLFNEKYICPICKSDSEVESTEDTLKQILGSEYNNMN